jgi:putative phosphoesterase
MKIGVLSDTHGEVSAVQRAIRVFQEHQVSLVIHCGDVGEDVIALFKGLEMHFVYGNVDDPSWLREEITESDHTLHEAFGAMEIAGCRVAFLHGDDVKLLHHTIHSGHWDMVCHGHTHAFSSSLEGSTLVLNPGALSRTSRPSLAVVDLPTLEVIEIAL